MKSICEEDKLKEALIQHNIKSLKVLEEEISKQPQYQFSKKFERKMKRLIASQQKEESKETKSLTRKLSIKKKVAILIAAIILIMAMLLTAEGNKEAIAKMFMEITKKFDIVIFSKEEGLIEEIREYQEPKYMATGYKKNEMNDIQVLYEVIYKNQNNNEIVYTQIVSNGTITNLDNEELTKTEVKINSIKGTALEKTDTGRITLYWYNDRYLFTITAYGVEIDELIKIAESVKIK